MPATLQISHTRQLRPSNPFLQCELNEGHDPHETALECPLFDFALTNHEMGARLIAIPAQRAFARHIHPNAYHFIYVIEGEGILEYDQELYTLHAGDSCLVRKGIVHKLGAGAESLLALVVNTPTYENGDPDHVHYSEKETLQSLELA